ncbi:similar to Saccharomyces cerevisiae YMR318C ADH6 NADPH-dependent medium chain alcohol dehydrogenase with broad substrate specificity [Maudiozyma saulgeensis]|uniref:alcohol dehydrogenase (NADP(+)) n=1 Tax=Maudiozyma saulgeensis TaxID=1789683 RepID=A0A1X7RC06_9SACH|nr:similar to Saccharomyces cerevisiae YMR318C ADH6 NADPH-dependent medium chain alcohol dehydrogenase with broad substrate specificity [Kazachstania saulgeensis]
MLHYPESFDGIGVVDQADWKHPKRVVFQPKKFDDYDIDVKIECCGVCGSDIHTASGHWGDIPKPVVVGHEIIGTVVRKGPKCGPEIEIGDRVGVGAQCYSCLTCDRCKHNNEPYCENLVLTYGYSYADGYNSKGGYASHVRVHEHFVVPIPENIPSELAGPLLCGGITVFSPLIRNGCGPGKKVGILGIGGIGHMGLIFAKALGAEVYAISRTSSKKEDAFKLGADHFIATKEEPDWAEKYYDTLDLVVVCAGSLKDVDFERLPKIMQVGGRIVSISVPEKTEQIVLKPFGLMGVSISNSHLGSLKEIKQLLKLVSEKNLKIWIETVPISEANVNKVFERMEKGDVRYRFVLTDYDKEFN